jgi:hypothetical protein
MDLLLVVIVLALIATGITLLIGLMSMAGGGATNQIVSTPLMWARVGLQAFTIILLLAATLMQSG